jgi:hypothetical protein
MNSYDARNHDDRIVRVRTVVTDATGKRSGRSLTGYLVADELVMTCAHDVVGSERCRVVPATGGGELQSEVAWPTTEDDEIDGDGLDVALLRVPGLRASGIKQPAWGAYAGFTGRVEAAGAGYPAVSSEGAQRYLTPVHGDFAPGEGADRGALIFTVNSARPSDPRNWRGLSGMMLRDSDGKLLGIASAVPGGWNGRQFHIVPAQLILDRPRLHELLGKPLLHALSAKHPLLKPSYELLGDETEFKLVTARYGKVPFVDASHGSDLTELVSWCTGTASESDAATCDVRVRMLLGPGGSGKTRLAAELCDQLYRSDRQWLTGFAREESDASWDTHEPQHPTLVVFDYVERPSVASKVARFLKHLDRLGPALQARVRILLVSRHAREWRDHINLQGGGVLSRRLQKEGDAATITLAEAKFTPRLRELHFKAAFERFAAGTDRAGLDLGERLNRLHDDGFNSPLLVHIAALLAARGDDVPFSQSDSLQNTLVEYLIRRERMNRWADQRAMTTTNAPSETSYQALHAVAIMTLTTPTVEEGEEFLNASKLWSDKSISDRHEAVRAVMRLYPGIDEDGSPTGRAAPIEPDLISEHLLMKIDDLEKLLENLHKQPLTVRHYARLLHILSLAGDHYPERGAEHFQKALREALKRVGDRGSHASMRGGDAVAELLAQSLPRLIESAARWADKHDPSTAAILSSALQRLVDNTQMQAMAAGLEFAPCQGAREMVELRCALLILASRHHRRNGDREALLACLEKLVDTLLELERNGEALGPLKEILDLRQQLGRNDPAECLVNVVQIDGLMDQFLARGQEGDAYRLLGYARQLHQRIDGDDFLLYQKYLRVFDALHPMLRDAGRFVESRRMVRESIKGRQMLGIDDAASYKEPVLALFELSDLFLKAGNHNLAAGTGLETIELLRALSFKEPAVYRDLLRLVDRALDRLMDDKGSGAFLGPLRESIDFRSWLAAQDPSYRAEYATALEKRSSRLWERNGTALATAWLRNAVDLRTALLDEDDPKTRMSLLASVYDLIAALTRGGGETEAIVEALENAASHWKALEEATPDARIEQALVLELRALVDSGDKVSARKAINRAEGIRQRLAAEGDDDHRRTESLYQQELRKSGRIGGSFEPIPLKMRVSLLRKLRAEQQARSDFLLAHLLAAQATDGSSPIESAKRVKLLDQAVHIYRVMGPERQDAYRVSQMLARIALNECRLEAGDTSWRTMREAGRMVRDCKFLERLEWIDSETLVQAKSVHRRIAEARDTAGKTWSAFKFGSALAGLLSPLVSLAAWYYILTVGRADGDKEALSLAPSWGIVIIMAVVLLYASGSIAATYYAGFVDPGPDLEQYFKWGFLSSLPLIVTGIVYGIAQSDDLAGVHEAWAWVAALGPCLTVLISAASVRLLELMAK